jgi:hypothetical protein
MQSVSDRSPEEEFLSHLDGIDIHYSFPRSTSLSPLSLQVEGVCLTERIRAGLSETGFTRFSEEQNGFLADRPQSGSP